MWLNGVATRGSTYGWIPSTSTLGAIDYGIEIVSTGGADATFQLDAFSLTVE
jgi:hypothetical protein